MSTIEEKKVHPNDLPLNSQLTSFFLDLDSKLNSGWSVNPTEQETSIRFGFGLIGDDINYLPRLETYWTSRGVQYDISEGTAMNARVVNFSWHLFAPAGTKEKELAKDSLIEV